MSLDPGVNLHVFGVLEFGTLAGEKHNQIVFGVFGINNMAIQRRDEVDPENFNI